MPPVAITSTFTAPTTCGTSAKFHKCTDRDQPPTAQSILVAAIASLSNDPNVFTDVCLCHVGVERQNLGLEFSNQPLERGDFCFQRLDALLQFCVGSAPWFKRASDLERDADLVWRAPLHARAAFAACLG
jgi:hypothetical protein